MKWDLEELSEDAVVSYLRTVISSEIRAVAAWEDPEPSYPCVVVAFTDTEPVSDGSEWADPQMLGGEVAIMTENASEVDALGRVVRSPRDRNRLARSSVLDALGIGTLNDKLIEQGIEAVAFSYAQLLPGRARSVEGKALVTRVPIGVIAEPVVDS